MKTGYPMEESEEMAILRNKMKGYLFLVSRVGMKASKESLTDIIQSV